MEEDRTRREKGGEEGGCEATVMRCDAMRET